MSTSMVGALPTVEEATCSVSSRGPVSGSECAVPERKRSAWDHCSPTTDTGFPHFDFHDDFRKKISCTGDT